LSQVVFSHGTKGSSFNVGWKYHHDWMFSLRWCFYPGLKGDPLVSSGNTTQD
jgi:hypothetical protein